VKQISSDSPFVCEKDVRLTPHRRDCIQNRSHFDGTTDRSLPSQSHSWHPCRRTHMRLRIISLRRFSAVIAVFLITLCCDPIGATEIQLADRGGIFTLPLKINGAITLEFMVDTGTPEVVVPDDIAATLIQSGAIKDSDFFAGTPYKMTDGSRFSRVQISISGRSKSQG
jgi:hypothetical protein